MESEVLSFSNLHLGLLIIVFINEIYSVFKTHPDVCEEEKYEIPDISVARLYIKLSLSFFFNYVWENTILRGIAFACC